jgi:hypothetical protein
VSPANPAVVRPAVLVPACLRVSVRPRAPLQPRRLRARLRDLRPVLVRVAPRLCTRLRDQAVAAGGGAAVRAHATAAAAAVASRAAAAEDEDASPEAGGCPTRRPARRGGRSDTWSRRALCPNPRHGRYSAWSRRHPLLTLPGFLSPDPSHFWKKNRRKKGRESNLGWDFTLLATVRAWGDGGGGVRRLASHIQLCQIWFRGFY